MIRKREVKKEQPIIKEQPINKKSVVKDNANNVKEIKSFNSKQNNFSREENNGYSPVKEVVKDLPANQQNIKQPKNIDPTRHKDFATYHEEACYVLDLLESKGVNIYDESRYGGMYLKHSGQAKLGHVFERQNTENFESEQKIDNNSLAALFGSK